MFNIKKIATFVLCATLCTESASWAVARYTVSTKAEYIPRWEAYILLSQVVDEFFQGSNYPERLKNLCKTAVDPEKHRRADGLYNAVHIRREVLNRIVLNVKNNAQDMARTLVDKRITLSSNNKIHVVFKAGDGIGKDLSAAVLGLESIGGFKKFLGSFRSFNDLVATLVEREIQALATQSSAVHHLVCCIDSDHTEDVVTLPCGDCMCKPCVRRWNEHRMPFTCPVCHIQLNDKEIEPYLSRSVVSWLLGR
jgi:hypothetical protein